MRKQAFILITSVFFICSLLSETPYSGNTSFLPEEHPTIFEHLSNLSAPVLEVTIKTDIKQLVKNKYDEDYQPATFSYVNDAGETIEWEIELRPRGVVRKQVCYYPPVKLKFKDPDLAARDMSEKHSSLKLVHQCKSGELNEQYVAKELLAYRLYNIVTDESFRVRTLHITYIDSGKKDKATEMLGFLIEDVDEMAQRLDGQAVKRDNFGSTMVEHEPYITMSVFQYMIGNTDWAIGNIHNLELVKTPEYRKVITVPYDFDYAGLVNTTYAVPAEKLPIQSVLDRLYRGPGCTEEEARAAIDHFLSLENEIIAFCETFGPLNERSKQDAINYLSKFFEELKSPEKLIRTMENN